jgi:hypothetical protein
VIYPSIGNFTWSKKNYTFGGQKGENKPSEPKSGNWSPISVWSCDISFDWEFYMKEKLYFRGSKRRKLAKILKINLHAKKINTSRHFKKCTLKKFGRTQKKKTS